MSEGNQGEQTQQENKGAGAQKSPALSSFSREFVDDVRGETDHWRGKANAYKGDADKARADAEAAKAAADARVAEAEAKANQRVIRAELKARAVEAGMLDLDGLKLLDIADIKLNDAGDVEVPEKFFEEAKKAKPWLFGARDTAGSSAKAPAKEEHAPKSAMDMTDEEYKSARLRLVS